MNNIYEERWIALENWLIDRRLFVQKQAKEDQQGSHTHFWLMGKEVCLTEVLEIMNVIDNQYPIERK